MRLNAKRILLIEPDEFQALIFADLEKTYSPLDVKFDHHRSTIEHSLGCDIDLDIDYDIHIDLSWPKRPDGEAKLMLKDFGTCKVTAWYGGAEIEHCICWTDSQYNQFIDELRKYIDQD